MDRFQTKFMDPTTDFGFKKLFGNETNKEIITSFLNDLLELETPLVDMTIQDKEQLPETREERSGIYDIYCHDAVGNRFIVEMQKSKLAYIKDRMLYYSTFPIAAQAKKGRDSSTYSEVVVPANRVRDAAMVGYGTGQISEKWNYFLNGVYCVAIMGYTLNDSKKAINSSSLRYNHPPYELYYDKLEFITIELPLFNENEPQYSLDKRINKWLYFLKYLSILEEIPDFFKNDRIFLKAFMVAQIANFTPAERYAYDLSLKRMRDSYAALETAEMTGEKRGKDEGIKIGEKRGKEEGIKIGAKRGKEEGIKIGAKRGKEEGIKIGEEQGALKAAKQAIILFVTYKLGPMPSEIETALHNLNDLDQINTILARVVEVDNWETLKKMLTGKEQETNKFDR